MGESVSTGREKFLGNDSAVSHQQWTLLATEGISVLVPKGIIWGALNFYFKEETESVVLIKGQW